MSAESKYESLMYLQGELEHRHVKRFYARTNKHKHELQIAQHTRRAEKLRIIKLRVNAARQRLRTLDAQQAEGGMIPPPTHPVQTQTDNPAESKDEGDTFSDPSNRYHIANSQRENDDLTAWVSAHRGDPAFKVREVLDARHLALADTTAQGLCAALQGSHSVPWHE